MSSSRAAVKSASSSRTKAKATFNPIVPKSGKWCNFCDMKGHVDEDCPSFGPGGYSTMKKPDHYMVLKTASNFSYGFAVPELNNEDDIHTGALIGAPYSKNKNARELSSRALGASLFDIPVEMRLVIGNFDKSNNTFSLTTTVDNYGYLHGTTYADETDPDPCVYVHGAKVPKTCTKCLALFCKHHVIPCADGTYSFPAFDDGIKECCDSDCVLGKVARNANVNDCISYDIKKVKPISFWKWYGPSTMHTVDTVRFNNCEREYNRHVYDNNGVRVFKRHAKKDEAATGGVMKAHDE